MRVEEAGAGQVPEHCWQGHQNWLEGLRSTGQGSGPEERPSSRDRPGERLWEVKKDNMMKVKGWKWKKKKQYVVGIKK